MKIIKETNRQVVRANGYDGVCDGCGSPLTYDGDLVAIEILNDDEKALLVPIDTLVCPSCGGRVRVIRVWKSLEVSKEFDKVSR